MAQTTITVDESTLARFKQLKAELNEYQDSVPDHTADSFLAALMDTWEAAEDGYYSDGNSDIAEQLDEIRNQLSMAPEYGVDKEEIVVEVDKRLDDLETELKTHIEGLQR